MSFLVLNEGQVSIIGSPTTVLPLVEGKTKRDNKKHEQVAIIISCLCIICSTDWVKQLAMVTAFFTIERGGWEMWWWWCVGEGGGERGRCSQV